MLSGRSNTETHRSTTCLTVSPSWLLIVRLLSSPPRARRFWELQDPHVIFLVCLPSATSRKKRDTINTTDKKVHKILKIWLWCVTVTQYGYLAWRLLIVDEQVSFCRPYSQQGGSFWPQEETHLIFAETNKKTNSEHWTICNRSWSQAQSYLSIYLMPLSIWNVLLTLASQRKMELDFAEITAKMSPSLSQSIPTQRLPGNIRNRGS